MLDFFGSKDPNKVLERANKQYIEGKLDSAIRTIEGGLSEAKSDFELLLMLARYYYENDQKMDAVTALRRANNLSPERGDAVVTTLSEIHYSGQSSIETGDLLLDFHIQRGEFVELERDLNSLDKRAIEAINRKYQRVYDNNIRQKSIEDLTKRDVNLYLLYSYLLTASGDSRQAVELLDRLSERKDLIPKVITLARIMTKGKWGDPYPYLLLTKTYIKHGEYQDALVAAQRAYEFDKAIASELLASIESFDLKGSEVEGLLDFKLNLYLEQKDIEKALPLLKQIYAQNPEKIDDVIKGFRDMERAYPDNIELKYFLGDLYLDVGRVTLAVEEYKKILESVPKEEDNVVTRLSKALGKDPKNTELINSLVELYLLRDELTKAVETIENAYKADPGLADEYIHNLNAILEKDIKNIKALYLLGECYIQKGQWENAAVVFDNLIELGEEGIALARKGLEEGRKADPDNIYIIKSLIGVMEQLGRYSDALNLVEEIASAQETDILVELIPKLDHIVKTAPELAPRAERIYDIIKEVDPFLSTLAAAEARAASHDYAKAVEEYKKALTIDSEKRDMIEEIVAKTLEGLPDASELTLFLAKLYLDDNKMDEASKLFLDAHKRNPTLVANLIDEYYQIIKDHPKDPSLRRVLVDALFTKGMYDQVLKEAKEAIENLGGKEKGYFLLKAGQALAEKGNLSDAVRPIMLSLDSDPKLVEDVIDSLNQIVEIDRNNIPAHFALGRAYGRSKKIDKAVDELMLTARIVPSRVDRIISELERLKSYSPASGIPYYARGFLFIENEEIKKGIEELERAMEMEPKLVDRILVLLQKLETTQKTAPLYLTLARAATIKGLVDVASKNYQEAFNTDPTTRERIIKGLKALIDKFPDSEEPKKVLANIYLKYGALDNAVILAKEILKNFPEEIDWANKIGTSVMELDSDHVASHYLVVEISKHKKDNKQFVETLKHLLEFAPQEVQEILNLVTEWLKDIGKDLEILLLFIDVQFLLGNIEAVASSLEKTYQLYPEAGDAILSRIKELLKREKTRYSVYGLASNIFIQQGELNRAAEILEMAERFCLDPQIRLDLFLRLTYIYSQVGADDKSKAALEEARRLTPDRKEIFRFIKRLKSERIKVNVEALKKKMDEKSKVKLAYDLVKLNDLDGADRVLQFTPSTPRMFKRWAIIKAKTLFLKHRPIDALTLLRGFGLKPEDDLDQKIAQQRMEIAEAIGFYGEALAMADFLSPYRDFQKKRDKFRSFLLEKMTIGKGMVIEGRL